MTKSKAKIRGRIVKPGPAQPLPESADPLAWLINRLQVDGNGQPLMEGIFSNYNDDILLEVDSNTLIGRYDPERGPAQRLEIGSGLRVEDGVLIGEGGGEKGDPGPPGPPGPMGPEGPAGASTSRFFYRFDRNSQVASDPGAGYLRYSATTPGATVRLYVDALTSEGFDVITMFKAATLDDEFLIQDKDNSANYHHFRQIGAGIDRGGWFEVPVAYVTQAGASFTQNQEIAVLLRARGEPGPVGPIGPIGPVGPQGPQGFQGPKGDTGNTGPVGPQGAQGNVGPQGQQGVVGPKGDTGAQGPQGNTGATGAKGDKGDQGVIGPRGDTGAQGPQGLIGPEGPKGDTGDTGPQGLQGIQGEQGEVGPAGPPGGLGEAPVDGKTYGRKDAAWAEVESGGASVTVGDTPPPAPEQGALWWESDSGIFWLWYDDGDSAQWVQTGEQGPIGPQGPPGADGADGATGAQGEVGPQGIQGPPGADGATGAQGAQGAQGLQGPQGPQGAQGIQGVQGPPGPWTQLTQAQYNALSPPNPATLYVIVG